MDKLDKKTDPTFEKALEELENIVTKMEGSQLPLDETMKYFEKGKKLSNYCNKKLSEYEKKIEILVKKNEKSEEWQEFKTEELF